MKSLKSTGCTGVPNTLRHTITTAVVAIVLSLCSARSQAQEYVSQPEISPPSGTFYETVEVSLINNESGISIDYTLETDGVISSRKAYTGPFVLSKSTVVRAIAKNDSGFESAVVKARFQKIDELAVWNAIQEVDIAPLQTRIDSAAVFSGGVIALQTDGTVLQEQIPIDPTPLPPQTPTKVVEIAAGPSFSFALTEDDKIRAWGNPDYINPSDILAPDGLKDIVSIVAGQEGGMALTRDGRATAWGESALNRSLQPPRNLANLVHIVAGDAFAIGILEDGSIRAWSSGNWSDDRLPQGIEGAVDFAFGNNHSLALKPDGTVLGWGGYAATPEFKAAIASWTNIVDIAASYDTSFGLRADGTIVSWPPDSSLLPDPRLDKVIAIDAQDYFAMAQREATDQPHQLTLAFEASKGHVRSSKQKNHFQDSETLKLTAIPVQGFGFDHWEGSIQSNENPLNLRFNGNLNLQAIFLPILLPPETDFDDSHTQPDSGQITLTNPNSHGAIHYTLDGTQPDSNSPIYESPIPYASSMQLRARCIGDGYADSIETIRFIDLVALLGYGPENHSLLDFPPEATDIAAVSAGTSHVLALKQDGTILTWTNRPFDSKVALNNVVSVAAGSDLNYALHSDGKVSIWAIETELWESPASLQNIISIKAQGDHFMALKDDGTVLAWKDYSRTALEVPQLPAPAIAIACGERRSLALFADGRVAEWTEDGSLTIHDDLGKVVAIEASLYYSVALREDGTVKPWGEIHSIGPSPTDIIDISLNWAGGYALRANGDVISFNNFYDPQPINPDHDGPLAWISVGESYTIAKPAGQAPLTPQSTIATNSENPEPTCTFQVPEGQHYFIRYTRDFKNWSRHPSYQNMKLSDGSPQRISPFDEEGHPIFLQLVTP